MIWNYRLRRFVAKHSLPHPGSSARPERTNAQVAMYEFPTDVTFQFGTRRKPDGSFSIIWPLCFDLLDLDRLTFNSSPRVLQSMVATPSSSLSADLHVVSTRAAFSDAFAAQYATCSFYKADGTAVRMRSVFRGFTTTEASSEHTEWMNALSRNSNSRNTPYLPSFPTTHIHSVLNERYLLRL